LRGASSEGAAGRPATWLRLRLGGGLRKGKGAGAADADRGYSVGSSSPAATPRRFFIASRVLRRGPLDGEAHAASDLLKRLLDARSLGEHRLAIRCADVVEVDVDREPRQAEHEQVEGGPSLEGQPRPEKRVRANGLEQTHENVDLLVGLDLEAAARGCLLELLSR
jgi:hypothetical protein